MSMKQLIHRSIAPIPHEIFGCTAVKNRVVDLQLWIHNENFDEICLLLTIEIIFRNGRFSKAVSIGASYLMPWTNYLYSLTIILNENAGKNDVDSISIILLERSSNTAKLTGARQPAAPDCRILPSLNVDMSPEDLGLHLGVTVAQMMVEVTREDVGDPNLDLTLVIPFQSGKEWEFQIPEHCTQDWSSSTYI